MQIKIYLFYGTLNLSYERVDNSKVAQCLMQKVSGEPPAANGLGTGYNLGRIFVTFAT
jgi:hypothetical protein